MDLQIVLLYFLLAHFIADFPLQFKQIVKLRGSSNLKMSLAGNSIHAGMHFVISLFVVIYRPHWDVVFAAVLISMLHGFIDSIKSFVALIRPFLKYSVAIFLIDQVFHLIIIYFTLYLMNINPSICIFKTEITFTQKLIMSFLLLLIGLWVVGVFIRILFDHMKMKPYARAINLKIKLAAVYKDDGANYGGYIIGILERLFIIISIVLDIPLVIGFILTAKSVARLKKFDDDCFVELFIIGSLISFISATVIGYIIKNLQLLPY